MESALNPADWSIDDLEAFIASRPVEDTGLEFKDSRKLLEDRESKALSADVSSFANANGGHIFYGVCEDEHNHASHVDDGIDTRQLSLLTIEHRLRGNIRPPIVGLKVSDIRLRNGNAVIVVSIPPMSADAPHQANDKRYYRRRHRKKDQLEDYEIRDILRRRVQPRLVFNVRASRNSDMNQYEVIVSNQSSEASLYNILVLYVPKIWNIVWEGTKPEISEHASYEMQGQAVPCKMYTWKLLHPNSIPLFREIGEVGVGTMKIERANALAAGEDPETTCLIPYTFACPGHKVTGFILGRSDSLNGWVQDVTALEQNV